MILVILGLLVIIGPTSKLNTTSNKLLSNGHLLGLYQHSTNSEGSSREHDYN